MPEGQDRWQRNYVTLSSGERIRYAFYDVNGVYNIRFKNRLNKVQKASTGAKKKPEAIDAAHRIIQEAYEGMTTATASLTWKEAKAKLTEKMEAEHKRPKTIKGYLETLDKLIQMFPKTLGPCDVSEHLAEEFSTKYATTRFVRKQNAEGAESYARTAKSKDSRLRTLKAVFKWFVTLRLCNFNPFENVAAPELDRHEVKYVTQDDISAFFVWLKERFAGWPMPRLFFMVKCVTACRLEDICQLRSDQLQEGRLIFTADTTKNRSERHAILPEDLYKALEAYKGDTWLWERYPPELIAANRAKGWPTHRQNPEFATRRLYLWVVQLMQNYQDETGTTLTSHDFRRAAFTRSAEDAVHPKLAAVAFDVTAETMLRYYTAAEKKKTADEVLSGLAGKLLPKV